MVEFLLASNAEYDLHDAVKNGDLGRVDALLRDSPQLLLRKDDSGDTPLCCAATYGRKDVAKLLLARGADVNAKGGHGTTPLHDAALLGHKDVAELLLASGADVRATDTFGMTPLHRAADSGLRDEFRLRVDRQWSATLWRSSSQAIPTPRDKKWPQAQLYDAPPGQHQGRA
ncbi:MAG: ankyrin repeat domain-containing protein [Acidobacteriaceae bacterium]|nr:ankyrin repeat domain-containing protein [Acidobacteriaceae bacterium]